MGGQIIIWTFLLLSLSLSMPSFAKGKYLSSDNLGEFYEYDLEGSEFDQLKRKASYYTKKTIKAPFKATAKAGAKVSGQIKSIARDIKLFLSDSHSVSGQRGKVKSALGNWEGMMQSSYDTTSSGGSPEGLAHHGFSLIKRSFYTVGVRVPRAVLNGIKNIIYSGLGVFK